MPVGPSITDRVPYTPGAGTDLVHARNAPSEGVRLWVDGDSYPRLILDTQSGAGTATGQILVGNGAAPPVVMTGVGAGSLPDPVTVDHGGTGQVTVAAGFDALAPTTTRGDLIVRGVSSNGRLGIGGASTVLASDGTDPSWIPRSGIDTSALRSNATVGGDLAGTMPNPTLAVIGAGATFPSSAARAPVVTVDTKGRVTAFSDQAIAGLDAAAITTGTIANARLDPELIALAGLVSAADRLPYFTGLNSAAVTVFTAYARTLVDDPDAATARTTLGLGTIATQNANAVAITGGSVTGITDVVVADGGTGASNRTAAFDNLAPAGATAGDLLGFDGTDWIRIPVGTNTQVLTVDTSLAVKLKWAAAAGGGGGNVSTDAIWVAAGDLAVGTGTATATRLAVGANNTVLFSNGTTPSWLTRAGIDTTALHAADIGVTVQAFDADLSTIAGLTATTDNFMVGASSAWASRTPAQARTSLGLVVGTDVQAFDAELAAIAGLTSAADRLPYFTGSGTAALATYTALARAFGALSTLTNHGVLVGQAAAAPVATAAGTSTQLFQSGGASADPGWITLSGDATVASGGALTLKNTGTAGTVGDATHVAAVTTDAQGRVTAMTSTAITGLDTSVLTTGTLGVARGGTGAATLTIHGVLIGQTTGAIVATSAGTATQLLQSGGASADPGWVTLSGDATIAAGGAVTLKNTGPGATGPIGDATHVAAVTIDAQGRVTALSSVAISASGGHVTADTDWAAKGDILVGTANDTAAILSIGTTGQVPRVSGGTLVYGAVDLTSSAAVTGALPIANGGTAATTALAGYDALVPTTTRGDITYRGATTSLRLAKGASGTVLTMGANDPAWATPLTLATDTLWDANGDIAVGTGADTGTRLAVSTGAGKALVADPGATNKVSWNFPQPVGVAAACLSSGGLASTIDRSAVPNLNNFANSAVLSTGRLNLVRIYLPKGMPITNITFWSATTAVGTATNQWFVLCDSSLNQLAITADDTSTAWAANSSKTLAITGGPYTITAAGWYYLGIMVKATTVPTLFAYAIATSGILLTSTPIAAGTSSTSLTNPASCPNPVGAMSLTGFLPYAEVS